METSRFGLTPEERENLTPQAENERKPNLTLSLLAFVSVLLLCALIAVALVIMRSDKHGLAVFNDVNVQKTPSDASHPQEAPETPSIR